MPRGYTFASTVALTIALMLAALPAGAQMPAPTPAPAPEPSPAGGPVHVMSFFEVGAASAGRTAGLLRPFDAATRKEPGNEGFLALHEIARPGRFAIVEVWHDKAAFAAHAAALAALRDKLQPLLASPFDTRGNSGLAVAGPALGAEPGAAVYVLTHVDVFPAGKDQAIEMLRQLADDSRKEAGNLRFDVLQQDGRLNHLPLVEAWHDARAREAHVIAEHTRAFRQKLVALQGALYDERLYKAIR
jgi:quinol monooxygenase YgiN